MALIQMQGQTGTDITPDYAQMIDEDILLGQVNGEPLESFLPEDLLALLPLEGPDNTRMEILGQRVGKVELRQHLIEHVLSLVKVGAVKPELRGTKQDWNITDEGTWRQASRIY